MAVKFENQGRDANKLKKEYEEEMKNLNK